MLVRANRASPVRCVPSNTEQNRPFPQSQDFLSSNGEKGLGEGGAAVKAPLLWQRKELFYSDNWILFLYKDHLICLTDVFSVCCDKPAKGRNGGQDLQRICLCFIWAGRLGLCGSELSALPLGHFPNLATLPVKGFPGTLPQASLLNRIPFLLKLHYAKHLLMCCSKET